MEHLKVGDIVWTMQTGYALVTSISDTKNYPIMVDGWASYTTDGMWGCRDKYRSLYLNNPFEDTDDFAIGFAEWLNKSDKLHIDDISVFMKRYERYTKEQALFLYKKEEKL